MFSGTVAIYEIYVIPTDSDVQKSCFALFPVVKCFRNRRQPTDHDVEKIGFVQVMCCISVQSRLSPRQNPLIHVDRVNSHRVTISNSFNFSGFGDISGVKASIPERCPATQSNTNSSSNLNATRHLRIYYMEKSTFAAII